MTTLRPKRPLEMWWIVAACSLVQGLQNALLQQAYGGYVVLLGQEFGWSKGILSWGSTEQQAVYGATGPGVGWLLDRESAEYERARKDHLEAAARVKVVAGLNSTMFVPGICWPTTSG